MSNLQTEIADAIKKTLPQSIGAELNSELAHLATFRDQAKSRLAEWELMEAQGKTAKAKISKLEADLSAHELLVVREDKVRAREAQQDNRDFQVKMYDQRHAEMLGLVGMVFKSPTFRTVTAGSVPVPVAGGSYNGAATPGMVMQAPSNLTKEETET